ncbi:MAG: MBL fold metallo-hydrolase [Desulfobulbus propionicus]|nr:MAG: MBL fold metallo-hydrolase [Desulfobulbus propionicus]
MKLCVLGSGSKGNSTLIESGGIHILIDCGFSGREIERRLDAIGCDPQSLTAILVTHEHSDHISGVGVLSRRYQLPVYINPATYAAAAKKLGKLAHYESFTTGESFQLAGIQVHPFAVSHDTVDPVGFVLACGDKRVGYCTDTGKVTKLISYHLQGCSALVLEANHDPAMLRNGPYPLELQQRIKSASGHLTNHDALRFAVELAENGLRHLVLAHLSEVNNDPQLVKREVFNLLGCCGALDVHVASQDNPGPFIAF